MSVAWKRGWGAATIVIAAGVAPVGGPVAAPDAGAGGRSVLIRMGDDMRFTPEHVAISVGDTVVWVNNGELPHTTTDTPGTAAMDQHNVLPQGAEPWDSGLLDPGERFRLVMTTAGDYTYLCTLHETLGMVGKLTVKQL